MIRVFTDGPVTDQLRALEGAGRITIVRDDSLAGLAAAWEIRDLNLKRTEPPGALADYRGTQRFESILTVLGFSRRLEAVRVDMAVGAGCVAFVTDNPDMLRRTPALEALLSMRFFHPARDMAALEELAGGGPLGD